MVNKANSVDTIAAVSALEDEPLVVPPNLERKLSRSVQEFEDFLEAQQKTVDSIPLTRWRLFADSAMEKEFHEIYSYEHVAKLKKLLVVTSLLAIVMLIRAILRSASAGEIACLSVLTVDLTSGLYITHVTKKKSVFLLNEVAAVISTIAYVMSAVSIKLSYDGIDLAWCNNSV